MAAAAGRADAASNATLTVSGTQWGKSTCFIGATEGGTRFDLADFADLGLNTYRVYGGFSRWEQQDDDGVFGSPSIAAIKADPNAVNWAWWDRAMTSPPSGTDYWWAIEPGHESLGWQGSADQMFAALKAARIRVLLTLRPTDDHDQPAWGQQVNPPATTAAWNEWWEHVFATAYWLNVRHDYGVDDYEVHNEPDSVDQGWRGTLTDYYELVRQTRDALAYVYSTYLPGRTFTLHAPSTRGGSSWPSSVLKNVGSAVDAVNVHDYDADITSYVEKVHSWMSSYGKADAPLWLSEWGNYELGTYDSPSFAVNVLLRNLIRGSRPGRDYVFGSHLFSMYDWRSGRTTQYENFDGLVRGDGTRRTAYYAVRLAARALQGCRPTFETTSSTGNLTAITTRDSDGTVNLLVVNSSSSTAYTIDANLSALLTTAGATVWRYDATSLDTQVGSVALAAGHATIQAPPTSGTLVRFVPGGDAVPPAAPVGLAATAVDASTVSLAWTASGESDLAGYHVYRGTASGFAPAPANRIAAGLTIRAYTDAGLAAATTYYYRVTAVDRAGNESPPSAEASATTPSAGGEPPPPVGNLALHRPVVASSFQQGYEPPKAVDGDGGTSWRPRKFSTLPDEWISVDVGGPYLVDRVVLDQCCRWAISYALQVSLDGVSWTTVYATTNGDGGLDTITFAPVLARYVRWDSTAWRHERDRARIVELEIYGG